MGKPGVVEVCWIPELSAEKELSSSVNSLPE